MGKVAGVWEADGMGRGESSAGEAYKTWQAVQHAASRSPVQAGLGVEFSVSGSAWRTVFFVAFARCVKWDACFYVFGSVGRSEQTARSPWPYDARSLTAATAVILRQ